jgi:hypothetical protein
LMQVSKAGEQVARYTYRHRDERVQKKAGAQHALSYTRRRLLLLPAMGLAGCDRLHALALLGSDLSEEDKALKYKFRGLRGGQLRVDSLFEVNGLNIFDDKGKLFFARASFIPPTGDFVGSYGAEFGVPKFIRVEWRDRYLTALDPYEPPPPGHVEGAFRGGTILGNFTVPVASRIPDDLLDAMRQGKGGFRLKIRIHPDGPLIGWDLKSGFETSMAGGDFQEARMVYEGDPQNPTKRWVKGWYIHPKTKERIETDF